MLNIPFLPWGLLQENEGFWTDEQEWLLEQNLLANAFVSSASYSLGIGGTIWRSYLAAYSLVIRSLLWADDELESIQTGSSPVNTLIEKVERAGSDAKELFERAFNKLQNNVSVEYAAPGEFSIQYSPADEDFGVSLTHEACWDNFCLLGKDHSGPHWPAGGFSVDF